MRWGMGSKETDFLVSSESVFINVKRKLCIMSLSSDFWRMDYQRSLTLQINTFSFPFLIWAVRDGTSGLTAVLSWATGRGLLSASDAQNVRLAFLQGICFISVTGCGSRLSWQGLPFAMPCYQAPNGPFENFTKTWLSPISELVWLTPIFRTLLDSSLGMR